MNAVGAPVDSIFCAHDMVHEAGVPGAALSGLTFVVKDVMQVAGACACFGNPTWLATHARAERHAPVVQRLLEQGAELCGLVITDELTLSLTGENAHYGTPFNTAAPGRVPGGSSSGSAAAVAAGLSSFALGTDTGGSVRVPASYCGVFGMRPTHGRIDREGVIPLCEGLDTVGWLARDAATLKNVGVGLLGSWSPPGGPRVRLILEDSLALLRPDARAAFEATCAAHFECLGRVRLADIELPPLPEWIHTYLTIQNAGLWAAHGAWLEEHRPAFGALIQSRADRIGPPSPRLLREAEAVQRRIRSRLAILLDRGGMLVLPAAGDAAHPQGLPTTEVDAITAVGLALSSVASLAGLPEVSVPLAQSGGLPLGVGIIGAAGADEVLLDESCRLWGRVTSEEHPSRTGREP